ncbi:hypothetical protein, partial [Globicatella sanguinis]|uniref:hypothetical protein n=1 Tax=Globicatella sanguinis TaxID=13076 RepID=UPI001C3F3F82
VEWSQTVSFDLLPTPNRLLTQKSKQAINDLTKKATTYPNQPTNTKGGIIWNYGSMIIIKKMSN